MIGDIISFFSKGFVRNSSAPNLIHSISLIQHDEKNVNVYAKEPHELTHAVDAIRYFCTSYTFAPDPEQIRNIANNYCFANSYDASSQCGE